MIDLWYLNTKDNQPGDLNMLLRELPEKVVSEVLRFKFHEDRRLKLFGKLLVMKYHKDKMGLEVDWNAWQFNSSGKPHFNGGKKFSISHSGEYVIVAFSEAEIGVDIERVADFDIRSVVNYLQSDEIEYIQNSKNPKDDFFTVWTRKEAYLKAIGKGITERFHSDNCLMESMTNNGLWFIQSIPFIRGYKAALCTQIPDFKIRLHELYLTEFEHYTISPFGYSTKKK
jgi:4'-phosphopantetheinyl transferase